MYGQVGNRWRTLELDNSVKSGVPIEDRSGGDRV